MAAADPGDDADGGGDEGASASVEGASSAPAGPVRELRNEAAGDAGDDGASGTEAGSGEAGDGEAGDGEGAPRRRRSRSRRSRSRKSADRVDGDAPEGDRPDGEAAEGGDVAVAPQEEKDADGEARTGARKKRSRRSGGRESSPGPGSSGSSASPSGGNRATNDRRVPRSNRPTIDQLLKRGQEVVVQITKEGIGTKGPTLTTYVSLPGRCLVLMPSLPKCGVSRKIEDGRERRRLKRVVKELDETGSGGIGFIVRTAGIDKSLEDVKRDRDYLKKIWEMVAQRLKVTKAPALLYQESDLVLKAMRDQFTPDIADVVVDSEDVYMRIRDFAEKLMPVMADRIKRHSVTTPLFHSFGIEKDVEELYEPQVNLSNGASIVIDQAEALVAIDVNSGKFKAGSHGSDETAYRTNLESITEIVRQLRLRDLGGLIIIDFIDMSLEKHRRNVERKMIESLRGDRARIKVGRISPFGMMEITRQRVGPGLKRTVFMQCPHCKGAGWSRTVQSKALSVLREARALVNLKGYSMLQVFVAPAVSDYLVNYKRRAVLEVEDAVGKTIVFRPEPSYPIDVVHYRFLTGDGQEARIAIPAGLGVKA
jgi:ribonuclease E